MSHDETRRRILSAAGPVFAEKGFERATVREICQRARVNVAAVNYHFGSKERLYIETVKWAHRPPDGEAWEADVAADDPPDRKLRRFIAAMVRRMATKRSPWHRQLMMREMQRPTAACRELVQEYFRARFDQLLGILDEILPPGTPADQREKIGLSIVGQCAHYHVAGEVIRLLVGERRWGERFGPDAIAEHVADFSLAALGLAPPLTQRGGAAAGAGRSPGAERGWSAAKDGE